MKFLCSSDSANAEDRIINRVRLLCENWKQPLQIAVSYWGEGALESTGLCKRIKQENSKPIQVLCDLFSGACNPDPIEELTNTSAEKVQVKTLAGLHAKVWICGSNVIVGSANVSSNGLGFDDKKSKEGNVEASVEVSEKEFAEKVQIWFNEQWERADSVTVTKIKEAKDLWKKRRKSKYLNKVKDSNNRQKSRNSTIPSNDVTDRFDRYEIFYHGLLDTLKKTDVPGNVSAPRKSGCFFRTGRSHLNYAVHFGEK